MSTNTWSANLNLSGVAARNVGAGYTKPVTGAYKVKIVGTEPNKNENTGEVKSVRFKTIVTEGDFAGTEIRVFIGLDTTKPGNLRSWKTAMLSAGYQAAEIEAGEVQIGETTFQDKDAFVYFKAADTNANAEAQDDRQFITPSQFNELNKGKAVSASSSVPSMTVAAPKPASSGLRSMLGK